MVNKKTLKQNKKQRGKSRKGGFFGFFASKPATGCDPNNLDNLKTVDQMNANYQTCCPKTWYGSKNSSGYCKQLEYRIQNNYKPPTGNAVAAGIDTNNNNYNNNNNNCDKIGQLPTTPDEMNKYIQRCNCNNVPLWKYSRKQNCKAVNANIQKQNNIENFKSRFPWVGYTEESLKRLDLVSTERKLNKQISDFLSEYPTDNFSYDEAKLRKYGPRKILQYLKMKFSKKYPPNEYNYTIEELDTHPKDVMNDIIDIEQSKNSSNPQYGYTWTNPETGRVYYHEEAYRQENLYKEKIRKQEEERKIRKQEEERKMGISNPYVNLDDYEFPFTPNVIGSSGGKRRTKKYLKKRRKTRKH
jgi:hypothetical protein